MDGSIRMLKTAAGTSKSLETKLNKNEHNLNLECNNRTSYWTKNHVRVRNLIKPQVDDMTIIGRSQITP